MESVLSVMDQMGQERASWFEHVLAGDIVKRKKPDPEVCLLALECLHLPARECLAIEASRVGMLATLAAGLPCVVTTSAYTQDEDPTGVSLVVNDLGDPPGECVALADLARLTTPGLSGSCS